MVELLTRLPFFSSFLSTTTNSSSRLYNNGNLQKQPPTSSTSKMNKGTGSGNVPTSKEQTEPVDFSSNQSLLSFSSRPSCSNSGSGGSGSSVDRFRGCYSTFGGLGAYNSLLQNGYAAAAAGYSAYNQAAASYGGCLNYAANSFAAAAAGDAAAAAAGFGLSSMLGSTPVTTAR